jgi:hypothetical protein
VVAGQAATCTATVKDTDTGTPAVPTGTVAFSSPELEGTFSPASTCALTGEAGTASCSLKYTPAKAGSGNVTVEYAGDAEHAASPSAHESLAVGFRKTQVTVSCGPGVVAGQPATCSATVADTAQQGTRSAPAGMVTFGSDLEGAFNPANMQCKLEAIVAEEGKASCSMEYTPAQAGSAKITAKYVGDEAHAESKGVQEALAVSAPAPPPQPPPTTTAPVATTAPSGPAAPRPGVPICRISVRELARTVGGKRPAQRRKVPVLSITYNCDQDAVVRIEGVVKVAGGTHGRKRTRAKTLTLASSQTRSVAGRTSAPVVLALPAAAVKALNAGSRTTTALHLRVQNANGRSVGVLRLILVAQPGLRRK